jgi:hypothetical protein
MQGLSVIININQCIPLRLRFIESGDARDIILENHRMMLAESSVSGCAQAAEVDPAANAPCATGEDACLTSTRD